MPFGEGLFPFDGGLFRSARLGVNVAEVRANGGIVRFAFDSFAQSGFSFREFILLEINPAEAVEIGAAVRLFLQRALHKRFGFVERGCRDRRAYSRSSSARGSVLRIGIQGFLEFYFGLVEKFLALVDGAEQEPRHFVVARLRQAGLRLCAAFFGFFVTACTFINLRDVEIDVAVGSDCSSAARRSNFHGFVGLPIFPKQKRVGRIE